MSTRSPRYPAIDLRDAVERVEQIFNKEHTNSMSGEVAAKHLGYGGINGASLKVLSALKKYGLMVGRADDLHVSTIAIAIIADKDADDQNERANALHAALEGSELFRKLLDRFGDKVSELNIKSHLIKEGFKPDAATKAASTYLESVAFVKEQVGAYSGHDKHVEEGTNAADVDTVQTINKQSGSKQTLPTGAGVKSVEIPLPCQPWPVLTAKFPMDETTWKQMQDMLTAMKPALVSPKVEGSKAGDSEG